MISSLYEDGEILVIDKPSGLSSQPGERVGSTVLSAVERDFGFTPYLVHRLDKETAGCMILAKTGAAASRWAALIEDRSVIKIYEAVCSGKPEHLEGLYVDPLQGGGKMQSASTQYRLEEAFGASEAWPRGFSLIQFRLLTGRTHQIRRHCALHSHPILGDDKYGDFPLNKRLRLAFGLKALLLWSKTLILPKRPPIHSAEPPQFSAFLANFPDADQREND